MKINPQKLAYNNTSGMIGNACMSPQCCMYMEPLKHDEFVDHMRLWKKSLPSRFHMDVANMIKQKMTTEEIYKNLIQSKKVRPDKHKKSKEEVI